MSCLLTVYCKPQDRWPFSWSLAGKLISCDIMRHMHASVSVNTKYCSTPTVTKMINLFMAGWLNFRTLCSPCPRSQIQIALSYKSRFTFLHTATLALLCSAMLCSMGLREISQCLDPGKAFTRAPTLFKTHTSVFTVRNLLRHYVK